MSTTETTTGKAVSAAKRNTRQEAELLLPKPVPPIPMGKLQASVPSAVLADLELYREAYRELNGAEIHLDTLIAHVLQGHMRRDKAFLSWLELNHRSASSL